jgi:chemotaxis protein CheC
MNIKLSELQFDALREINHIGCGNAATRLSQMLHRKIKLWLSEVRLVELKDLADCLGGEETPLTAVYFEVSGNLHASLILLFPPVEANHLAKLILGEAGLSKNTSEEMRDSVLKETGNILIGAYVNALSQLTRIKLRYSIPGLATDMLQALLDGLLIQLSLETEMALFSDATFEIEEEKVKGTILFLPDPKAWKEILERLCIH